MTKQWKCTECVKHNTDACFNGGRFDDDTCKYMLIDVDYAYEQGYQDGATDMEQAKQIIIDSLLKQIEQIRADVIEECIKTLTDYCCGMPNNNLISALEQLKEQKNE